MKCICELYVICGMYVESYTILVVVNRLSRPVVVLDGLPGLYGFKYDSATACGLPLYLYSYKLVGSATITARFELENTTLWSPCRESHLVGRRYISYPMVTTWSIFHCLYPFLDSSSNYLVFENPNSSLSFRATPLRRFNLLSILLSFMFF